MGLQIANLYEWKGAVAEGVVVLNQQTQAWELNRQASELIEFFIVITHW